MKTDKLYVVNIVESIQRIEQYTKEGKETFLASMMIQDAVIRNFEIIGEAVKHLSTQFKETYPDVPWRRISGLRDVLIHDYMGVDTEEIWNIVERDLLSLKQQIESILRRY